MRMQNTVSGLVAVLLLTTGSALAQPGAPGAGPPAPFSPAPDAPASTPAPSAGAAPVAPSSAPPAVAAPAADPDQRPHGFIPQLSLGGPIGLVHMSSAEVDQVGVLHLGLHGEYFSGSNVLVAGSSPSGGDHDSRVQGALTFGIAPLPYLELFGAVLGSANRNDRDCSNYSGIQPCVPENNRTDPILIKSYGDIILGAKAAFPLAEGFAAGGELGFRFMSATTGLASLSGDSTSVWIGGLASYDLKPATKTVPLRFHLNLGYYIDNSHNLKDYDAAGTSATSRYVSKFAYGISASRFRLALGTDAPFDQLTEGFALRPMLEYHFEYLTGSKDQVIYDQEHATCGKPGAAACTSNKDQHWVTLGAQAQIVHGLTFTVGVDLALRSPGFAYGPSLPPWNLLFGMGYPFDLVTRVVTVQVPVEKVEPMREGLIAGRITTTTGTPIEGAVVGITGRRFSRVLTDADGTFQSRPLAPGLVELVIAASGFDPVSASVDIIAGQTANIAFALTPHAPPARAIGRITDDQGKGVVATLKLAGPQIAEARSDESGNFAILLQAGQYVLRADADRHFSKITQVTVADGRETPVSVTLRNRPVVAGVAFQDGKFKLRQPVVFKAAGKAPSADLTTGAMHVLDEVVDILINHPEIRQVRVEAHWDRTLPPARAQELTDNQAKAVAKYLADEGVGQERIVAEGMGSTKPVVPNLGRGAKPKNRRIEFSVVN